MFGWAMPLPHLLHYLVFLPAPTLKLLLIGNQCDNTNVVKITNIQVDVTFIIPKSIDIVPS